MRVLLLFGNSVVKVRVMKLFHKLGLSLLACGVISPCQAVVYDYAPLNLKAKKLPVNYLGTPCLTLYSFLKEKNVIKGKYETTAAFRKRKAKVDARPLVGTLHTWSPLGISFPVSWSDYDADTQKFSAHFVLYRAEKYDIDNINFDDISATSKIEFLQGITEGDQDYSRSYTAQNGFGARVEVQESGFTGYGLAIMNWRQFPFTKMDSEGSKYRVSYTTKIPGASASRLAKNIRTLYVGYLTSPYKLDNYKGSEATFNSPTSENYVFHYACMRIKQVWFYDYSTGYIYAKRPM